MIGLAPEGCFKLLPKTMLLNATRATLTHMTSQGLQTQRQYASKGPLENMLLAGATLGVLKPKLGAPKPRSVV